MHCSQVHELKESLRFASKQSDTGLANTKVKLLLNKVVITNLLSVGGHLTIVLVYHLPLKFARPSKKKPQDSCKNHGRVSQNKYARNV